MSLLKVDKIEPKSSANVLLKNVNLDAGSVNTAGGTNLRTAAEKDATYFFKKVTGTPSRHMVIGPDGELEDTGYGPGDISDLVTRMGTAEGEIDGLSSGGPKGVYADLAALIAADPDHSQIYLLLSNGHWAYYNSSTPAFEDSGYIYSDTSAVDAIEARVDVAETDIGSMQAAMRVTHEGVSYDMSYKIEAGHLVTTYTEVI